MRASLVYPFGHGDQRIECVGGHQVGQRMLAYPRPTLSTSDSSPFGTGLLGRGHLLAQTGEVGGEERGGQFHSVVAHREVSLRFR